MAMAKTAQAAKATIIPMRGMVAGDGQEHRRGTGCPGGACLGVSIDNAPSTEGDLNSAVSPGRAHPHRVTAMVNTQPRRSLPCR
jgi:hypothetical protein